ncbi:DNA polymerase I [Sulfuricella sp. T08]|uniref:DNA polymerase I n=1 Tax=Sulfuricella sp. T08 TaxID=1632857 RepID=UPI000617995C|nr:DNA polymerase I [Sulfuricella sp. T08]GAO36007.1 DNA polymerase I [Sulfuricella sp. T08]
METKTLLLVDGSSYLYRAFHALPDLRNRHNEPTGAIYGVLNMLRRLHKDYNADYSACVFDAKGKTFRDDLYPEYKAHRPPMPDDLARQIEPLHEAIRAMGWPLLMVDGVEADDVIGTLSELAWRQGIRTVISTGDKDMAQLVNPHVTLVNTMSNERLDEAGVTAKFGVPAARIVDYLSLVGDAVDGVPGVDKVGPKTAVKWLAQYGSLDNLIAHAGEIGGVVGENLRNTLDWLPKGRELVTIKCDVVLPVELTELGPQPQDTPKLIELFERCEFKTWLRELSSEVSSQPSVGSVQPSAGELNFQPPVSYETVLTQEALDRWLEKIADAELISVDTETTSLDPLAAQIVGISLATEAHLAAYIPLAHHYAGVPQQLDREMVLNRLKPLLESKARPKLGQNLKYDKHVFANHGIILDGIVHDTLLQSYVLESHKPHDMDSMALRHLGTKTITYAEVAGKGAKQIGFDQVDLETATRYAAEDADITLQLHQNLYPQIEPNARLDFVYRHIEIPLLDVLFTVERNGVLLDTQLLAQQSHELGTSMLRLEKEAHLLAGQPFNLNSPKQIQEILFDQLKLPVKKKTPSGAPSTDEDVLQELALDYPLPKVLLEYRGVAKLKSTYTDKLPRMVDPQTGRVHTRYNQAVAVTGRLASSDPNLQNIPVRSQEGRRIREAFIATPGSHIIAADYSQIELRIMAHLSSDESLLKAFAAGEDIHRATAAEVFGTTPVEVSSEQRRYAKVINFGLIYGMSAFGLASQLGIERSAAQSYMERYFARYPGVARYMERTREAAKAQGYVETVFGRRLWLPEISGANGMRRQAAERAAINAPMQGTAADLIKLAMIAVQGWLEKNRMQSLIIMQVHDELVLEVPDAEMETVRRELPGLMCGVAQLAVPLVVDVGIGPNWERAH